MKQKVEEESVLQKKGKIKGHVRHRQSEKARRQAYLIRLTCVPCGKVFFSPKKRFRHIESGHKSLVGWNQNRSTKSSNIVNGYIMPTVNPIEVVTALKELNAKLNKQPHLPRKEG